MSQTARLGLPYIVSGQAQKEVTHNEGLNKLDAFVTPVVADIADSPPGSPAAGDLYIVGSSPSGDFTGHANQLAQYQTGGWVFYAPFKWMDAVVESLDSRMAYDGSAWVPFGLIMRDGGEYMRVLRWQDDVDLSLGDETAMLIPNRSTVLAVNTRVMEAVTGTVTSFGVGVSGDTSRYGNGIGTGADSTNIGLTYHPVSYYSDTPLLLTPDAGSFTGGLVRINVQYLAFRGPWHW
ncbi:MAG: DUF2793 domain-containing protein [Alphaproteobacteria bacterium]|jgi:hypothetical protein|nr:DUF2793 domain-containing protein [Alphaproteobacteria bacterium]